MPLETPPCGSDNELLDDDPHSTILPLPPGAPLLASDVLTVGDDGVAKLYSQLATFGHVLEASSPYNAVPLPTLFLNLEVPINGLICGLPDTEQSHSLCAILESALIEDSRLGSLSQPLSVLTLVMDNPNGVGAITPSQAARISLVESSQEAGVRRPPVTVLTVSESVEAMRNIYRDFEEVDVKPICLCPEDLKGRRMATFLRTAGCTPSLELQRFDMFGGGSSLEISTALADLESLNETSEASAQLGMRMSLLKRCVSTGEAPLRARDLFQDGALTIVHLSSALIPLDIRSATKLFGLVIDLFLEHEPNTKKLIVLENAHEVQAQFNVFTFTSAHPLLQQYIGSSESEPFVDSLQSLMRSRTSAGVLISTQEPTAVPDSLLQHCGFVFAHRFHSPAWLAHLMRHFPVMGKERETLLRRIIHLKRREVVVLAPSALIGAREGTQSTASFLGMGYLIARSRALITRTLTDGAAAPSTTLPLHASPDDGTALVTPPATVTDTSGAQGDAPPASSNDDIPPSSSSSDGIQIDLPSMSSVDQFLSELDDVLAEGLSAEQRGITEIDIVAAETPAMLGESRGATNDLNKPTSPPSVDAGPSMVAPITQTDREVPPPVVLDPPVPIVSPGTLPELLRFVPLVDCLERHALVSGKGIPVSQLEIYFQSLPFKPYRQEEGITTYISAAAHHRVVRLTQKKKDVKVRWITVVPLVLVLRAFRLEGDENPTIAQVMERGRQAFPLVAGWVNPHKYVNKALKAGGIINCDNTTQRIRLLAHMIFPRSAPPAVRQWIPGPSVVKSFFQAGEGSAGSSSTSHSPIPLLEQPVPTSWQPPAHLRPLSRIVIKDQQGREVDIPTPFRTSTRPHPPSGTSPSTPAKIIIRDPAGREVDLHQLATSGITRTSVVATLPVHPGANSTIHIDLQTDVSAETVPSSPPMMAETVTLSAPVMLPQTATTSPQDEAARLLQLYGPLVALLNARRLSGQRRTMATDIATQLVGEHALDLFQHTIEAAHLGLVALKGPPSSPGVALHTMGPLIWTLLELQTAGIAEPGIEVLAMHGREKFAGALGFRFVETYLEAAGHVGIVTRSEEGRVCLNHARAPLEVDGVLEGAFRDALAAPTSATEDAALTGSDSEDMTSEASSNKDNMEDLGKLDVPPVAHLTLTGGFPVHIEPITPISQPASLPSCARIVVQRLAPLIADLRSTGSKRAALTELHDASRVTDAVRLSILSYTRNETSVRWHKTGMLVWVLIELLAEDLEAPTTGQVVSRGVKEFSEPADMANGFRYHQTYFPAAVELGLADWDPGREGIQLASCILDLVRVYGDDTGTGKSDVPPGLPVQTSQPEAGPSTARAPPAPGVRSSSPADIASPSLVASAKRIVVRFAPLIAILHRNTRSRRTDATIEEVLMHYRTTGPVLPAGLAGRDLISDGKKLGLVQTEKSCTSMTLARHGPLMWILLELLSEGQGSPARSVVLERGITEFGEASGGLKDRAEGFRNYFTHLSYAAGIGLVGDDPKCQWERVQLARRMLELVRRPGMIVTATEDAPMRTGVASWVRDKRPNFSPEGWGSGLQLSEGSDQGPGAAHEETVEGLASHLGQFECLVRAFSALGGHGRLSRVQLDRHFRRLNLRPYAPGAQGKYLSDAAGLPVVRVSDPNRDDWVELLPLDKLAPVVQILRRERRAWRIAEVRRVLVREFGMEEVRVQGHVTRCEKAGLIRWEGGGQSIALAS